METGVDFAQASLPSMLAHRDRQFRIVRRIGRGAAGVVYEIYDALAEQSIAAKMIDSVGADQLYGLKHEFRTLSDLRHPNLVRLYELFVEEQQCFFTMELLAAQDFISALCGTTGVSAAARRVRDFEFLRDVLRQLVVGLEFLHDRGIVHRDVKPANVLVEPSGRVVLLDFGFAGHLDEMHGRSAAADAIVGTPAYMAPESITTGEFHPTGDFFSAGVMLFEALTGARPFGASYFLDILSHSPLPPTDPGAVVEGIPEDLCELTVSLLNPIPERRPTARDILDIARRRAPVSSAPMRSPQRDRHPFVGRNEEQRRLRDALTRSRGGVAVVEIVGPSGIGKTSLVEQFLAEFAGSSQIHLESICHPREKIPFKLIDGLVDGLAESLGEATAHQRLPPSSLHVAALLRTFPVMGRIAELVAGGDAPLPSEPHEIRRAAFECLRTLLTRLAEERPVILWIDDAQWGDADSLSALEQLLLPPKSPKVLLVVSHRLDPDIADDTEMSDLPAVLARLDRQLARLALPPLDDAETRTLAAAQLTSLATDASAIIDRVALGAEGIPALVVELSDALATAPNLIAEAGGRPLLQRLLAGRMQRLDEDDQRALEIIAVAGRPLDEHILGVLLNRRIERLLDLVDGRLLRLVPRSGRMALGPYHDAVREVVVTSLGTDQRRQIHFRLATAFETAPGGYEDSLVDHWVSAGMPDKGVDSAVALGAAARAAGAFLRSASHYRRALELDQGRHPRWLLLAKLAGTLMDAGRSSDAAPILVEAANSVPAETTDDNRNIALRRRAVSAYLRSGLYREGTSVLQEATRSLGIGYPEDRLRSLWWIASARARLKGLEWKERLRGAAHRRPASPGDIERLELLWSAGQGLSFMDAMRSAAFQAKHAHLAHTCGEARHRARALSADAMFLAWRHGERHWRRVVDMLDEGEQLARSSDDPIVISHNTLMRACALALNTQWESAFRLAEAGHEFCRSNCRGARWELVMFQQTMLLAETMTGRLAAVADLLARFTREAEENGDEFARASLPIGIPNLVWLGRDEPAEAERQIQQAIGDSFSQRSLWFLYHGEYARGHIDLYLGDGLAGDRRIARLWNQLRGGGFLQTPSIRINMRDLRARCLLFAAERQALTAHEFDRLLSGACHHARRMRAERASWAQPFVDRIEGAAAALRGDVPAACELLEHAAAGFKQQGLGLIAAGTRLRIARLAPGGTAEGMQNEAEQWMHANGTLDASKMMPLC